MTEKAKASPTKEFFVHMITKDIALSDCILDLLDNSVDGARGLLQRRGETREPSAQFDRFVVSITLAAGAFEITDNCGGITLPDARDYAFHFGRARKPVDGDPELESSIGLYGIGLKRAVFKLGQQILIESKTDDEEFRVDIDVEHWLNDQDPEWGFPLEEKTTGLDAPGTRIKVTSLYEEIGREFLDEVFVGALRETIGRDYALMLHSGLRVLVNGEQVAPVEFAFREGGEFAAARVEYDDGGVHVAIQAGMGAPPPDEESADARNDRQAKPWGWYVLCNSRVVLAADKSVRTGWGDASDLPGWHYQYNGFLGLVHFTARDPNLLPWTTTKRDLDVNSPIYRRALVRMRGQARAFIDYTNRRKADLNAAKQAEAQAASVPVAAASAHSTMRLPTLSVRRIELAHIKYSIPIAEFRAAAQRIGGDANREEVGKRTFRYYYEREVVGGEE